MDSETRLDPWGLADDDGAGTALAAPRRPQLAARRIGLLLLGLIATTAAAIGWLDYGRPWMDARDALLRARLQRAGAMATGAQDRLPRLMDLARRSLGEGERCLDSWRFEQARAELAESARTYSLTTDLAAMMKECDRIRARAEGMSRAELAGLIARLDERSAMARAGGNLQLEDARKLPGELSALLRQVKDRIAAIESEIAARREWQGLDIVIRAALQARTDGCFPEAWNELRARVPEESAAAQVSAAELAELARRFSSLRDRAIAASLEAQAARREMEGSRDAASPWVSEGRRGELFAAEQRIRETFDRGRFLESRDGSRSLARQWRQERLAGQFTTAMQQAMEARETAAQAGAPALAGEDWRAAVGLVRRAEDLQDQRDLDRAAGEAERARRMFVQAAHAARDAQDAKAQRDRTARQ